MQTISLRNLFHLHRYKIILLFFTFFSFSAFAQKGNYNFLDFQLKQYYFGIALGYNTSSFKEYKSHEFNVSDSIGYVQSIGGPGFNVAIVTNLKMGDYFDLRFLPALSFTGKDIVYKGLDDRGINSKRKINSVLFEIPFQVRYKSKAYHDMRFFVLAGIKYSYDVVSDSKARNADDLVKISPSDFALEAGFGMQFFFPYFILSPEIKFSHGLNNVLIYDNDLPQSQVLQRLLSRALTITFNFEG